MILCKPWILQTWDLHMYVEVILFVMCRENHTMCNVYINLTQPMFGSCFTSSLLEGACLIYVNCVCVCIVVSNIHCVVFLLYFISYCVSFSRLSCLDCLWYSLTFSNRRLTFFPNCIWTPTSSAKHNNLASVVWHTSLMLFHFNTVTTNFNGEGGNLSL